MQDFSPSRLQLDFVATDFRQSYADAIRQLLTETEELLSLRDSIMLSADSVHQMDDVLDRLLTIEPPGQYDKNLCKHALFLLDTLAQNTGDIVDGALTEAAVRESLEEAVLSPMPATRASVEALEKFVFDGGVQRGSSSDQRCVVCLGKMLSEDQVTCLPCSHMFHGHCIEQWLRYGHVCPLCRFKLPTDY
ncbi:hypothetical protein ACE6H2_017057 [Prunus campanulata]